MEDAILYKVVSTLLGLLIGVLAYMYKELRGTVSDHDKRLDIIDSRLVAVETILEYIRDIKTDVSKIQVDVGILKSKE